MKDKFSLYQADGFWGIIEDASDEKQTSVKSYIGPDLIVKRLNEQAKQIEELNQRLVSKDKYIDELENDLNWERGNKLAIHKQFADRNCYVTLEDYKADIAEKDKEIEELKQQYTILENENGKLTTELIMDKYKKAKKEVSFGKQLAIQELEKVKELLLDEYKKYPIVYDKTNDIVAGALDRDKVNEIIDQQIKELKGEKDEV